MLFNGQGRPPPILCFIFNQRYNPSPNKRQTVTSPEREAAIAWFWNQYIAIIHEKGIKEPFDRWFVIRAQHYIEAFPDKRLALYNRDDLKGGQFVCL